MSKVLPILFNTEMVRAILDGKKTVTRRVMKPQPIMERHFWKIGDAAWSDNITRLHPMPCHSLYNRMPCHTGDTLYVRESFCSNYFDESIAGDRGDGLRGNRNAYKADYRKEIMRDIVPEPKWTPSIHMPKQAARIWLKVTDVRVERLQEISVAQAIQEGIAAVRYDLTAGKEESAALEWFPILWDSTIKKADIGEYGWKANPWVWVIKFERCERPEEGI